MDKSLEQKLSKIKLLALDFDGVMTDGFVYVDETGKETVRNSRLDSFGIGMLRGAGIKVVVLSTEANRVVSVRCKKLNIKCTQKIDSREGKAEIFKRTLQEENVSADGAAYVGDDVNDLDVFKIAGVKITVADGHRSVIEQADYVTKAKGGDHAVREICELVLAAGDIEPTYELWVKRDQAHA